MLVLGNSNPQIIECIKDDPVRPHLSAEYRTKHDREVWAWYDDRANIGAVICVAYTNEVPTCERELELYSQQACQDGEHGSVAVFYTVWSYSKGSARQLVLTLGEHIVRTRPVVKRLVTLSPLTEMAEQFHIRNGARLIYRGDTAQNFEYSLEP